MGPGLGDPTSDLSQEALEQGFHQGETTADYGDIEFETGPDGFFGTRCCVCQSRDLKIAATTDHSQAKSVVMNVRNSIRRIKLNMQTLSCG